MHMVQLPLLDLHLCPRCISQLQNPQLFAAPIALRSCSGEEWLRPPKHEEKVHASANGQGDEARADGLHARGSCDGVPRWFSLASGAATVGPGGQDTVPSGDP